MCVRSAIEQVAILWPGGESPEIFRDVPLDTAIRVEEGKLGFEKLVRKRVTFPE